MGQSLQRKADISGIFSELVALLSEGAKGWLMYVVVIGGLGVVGVLLGLAEGTRNIVSIGGSYVYRQGDGAGQILFGIATSIISILASYSFIAYLLDLKGRLRERSTRIWAYVGLTILSIIGILVGLVLLIIPGIVILVRWSAASGFLIEGRRGVVDALSDSWDATRGHAWQIFAAGLLTFIGLAIVTSLVSGVLLAQGAVLSAASISQVTNAIGNAVFIAFGVAVYLLVTDESAGLAEIFD